MLRLQNNLTRQKEDFQPLEANQVKMYVCGPTVYGLLHIGNGRTFMFWDVARRYLEHRGYEVMYVQNFTDVDDKIINRAREEGSTADEVAAKYTDAYFEDMDALGVRRATHYPKATQEIPAMIAHIQGLIDKGFAYAVDGDVYFRVQRFAPYGKLSGRTHEDNEAGARVEVDARKEHPADFAMWKAAKPGEPFWQAPWGQGRPGWHIECSAMVRQLMGDTIDIHAGGMDLKFPHHENEIAQSEALTGAPFVRYWLHTGFLNMDAEKMSKSLGNVRTVRDVLKAFKANHVRVFMLGTHYSQELNFTEQAVESAAVGWENLRKTVDRIETWNSPWPQEQQEAMVAELRKDFRAAMDDDLNTPAALAVLHTATDNARKTLHAVPLVVAELRRLAQDVLGLDLSAPEALAVEADDQVVKAVEEAIAARAAAKASKDWPRADALRKGLLEAGVKLTDQKTGETTWEWAGEPAPLDRLQALLATT